MFGLELMYFPMWPVHPATLPSRIMLHSHPVNWPCCGAAIFGCACHGRVIKTGWTPDCAFR
jgi:hypothetical protein